MKLTKNQIGFTVMELIVAIVIMGVLAGVGFGVIVLNVRTFNAINQNTVQRWDVRNAMQLLEHDIQMLHPDNLLGGGFGNGQGHAYGALRNRGKKLYFTDIDGNTVRYRMDNSGNLERRIGSSGWTLILAHLTESPFQYLDIDENLTPNKDDILYIDVVLSQTVTGKNVTISERFYVRN